MWRRIFKIPILANVSVSDEEVAVPEEPGEEPSLGYGLLYNFYAATDARGVLPNGFRLPTSSELSALDSGRTPTQLSSTRVVADGDPYWSGSTAGGTDDFGFSAQGSGFRESSDGSFLGFRTGIQIWSSTLSGTDRAFRAQWFGAASSSISMSNERRSNGFAIRGVSDSEPASEFVSDAEGNLYSWILLDGLYWMAQSLKTKKFNNGEDIPSGFSNSAWANLLLSQDPGFSYPNGDSNLPI